MNLKTLRAQLPALLASGVSIELISAPGRGKSELIRDYVNEVSTEKEPFGFSTAFLGTYTPPDLLGYMFKGEREYDGRKITVTDPTLPMWMITTEGKPLWHYKRGILFLDEFAQSEGDVKRSAAELLLNRQLGPWKMPPGWTVIAASNRMTDRSGVTKSLDFVINRRVEIHISDSIEAWTEWAVKNRVQPLTIAFANQNTAIVFADGVPENQGPWCTPRSLVMADRIITSLGHDFDASGDKGKSSALELVGGMIGDAAAAQYFAFVRLEREMPKFATIIKDPKGVKVPTKPDAQMLVCYDLAHRVDKDTAKPVIEYVERMPKEFAVTFASAACKRDPSLVATPAMSKWAMANATLMAAISQ